MTYLISHSKKFVFVHIPKTAGTSVTNVLISYDDHILAKRLWRHLIRPLTPPQWRPRVRGAFWIGHLSAAEIRAFVPEFDALFTFAFVRNPWDLHVSLYEYIRRTPIHPGHAFYKNKTFAEYLETQAEDPAGRQASWLSDGSGKLLVKFAGRFERLQDDFRHICEQIGVAPELPHLNRTSRNDYRDYYTAATRDLVARIDKRDVELFNYSF